MPESPEVQLAQLGVELKVLQRDTAQQNQTLRIIETEIGKTSRKADRFEGRLTELEEHSRETVDGLKNLHDLVQKRNAFDTTQIAAAQLIFKWGGWFCGVLLIVISLLSGKMQEMLENIIRLFGHAS